jgi:hypothetical protein
MNLHASLTHLLSDLTCDRFKTTPITCFDNMRQRETTRTCCKRCTLETGRDSQRPRRMEKRCPGEDDICLAVQEILSHL